MGAFWTKTTEDRACHMQNIHYFNYMTGKGVQKEFKRYAYTISDQASNLTLIHYKGDDSIVNENPHVRTCGSVLRELENSTQSPSVVYKKKIVDCSSTMLSPVLLPRNRKQVSNCQHLVSSVSG